MIFTTLTQELPKSIMRRCMVRVSVRPAGPEEVASKGGPELVEALEARCREHGLEKLFALATGYRLKVLPSFMEFVKKEYFDFFPLHYPVYERYEKVRRAALRLYFAKWESAITASKTERERILEEAVELVEKGASREEIYRFLVEKGLPKSTASRWAGQIVEDEMDGL